VRDFFRGVAATAGHRASWWRGRRDPKACACKTIRWVWRG